MRYFTLSAVCVLVFCMLMAVGGTTDMPRYEKGFFSRLDSGSSDSPMYKSKKARALQVSTAYVDHYIDFSEIEAAKAEKRKSQKKLFGLQVRYFGFLFVLVWIFISLKLLTAK